MIHKTRTFKIYLKYFRFYHFRDISVMSYYAHYVRKLSTIFKENESFPQLV